MTTFFYIQIFDKFIYFDYKEFKPYFTKRRFFFLKCQLAFNSRFMSNERRSVVMRFEFLYVWPYQDFVVWQLAMVSWLLEAKGWTRLSNSDTSQRLRGHHPMNYPVSRILFFFCGDFFLPTYHKHIRIFLKFSPKLDINEIWKPWKLSFHIQPVQILLLFLDLEGQARPIFKILHLHG